MDLIELRMHDINGKYVMAAYYYDNSITFEELKKRYYFIDLAGISNYDSLGDKTSFKLQWDNDKLILFQKIGNSLMLDGNVKYLPFPMIENHGIVDILNNRIHGTLSTSKELNKYSVFKVNEICGLWLEGKYFDFIKDKCKDSAYIVFEIETENLSIQKGKLLPIKEYNVFFNEMATSELVRRLPFMACGVENNALTFNSTKEFSEIFTEDFI